MAEAILHKPLGENSNPHPQVRNNPGWSIKPFGQQPSNRFGKRKIHIELQFRIAIKYNLQDFYLATSASNNELHKIEAHDDQTMRDPTCRVWVHKKTK